MKISILVPVYNVAGKIERCAVSLFEQTYQNLEYIFVDDCTPDRSIDVLEEVLARYPERKEQVRIIRHEKNKGLAGARNTGYDNATGELIMIVDSDDYLSTDACEKLLGVLQENNADIASGAYVSLRPDGTQKTFLPSKLPKEKLLRNHLCMSLEASTVWGRLYRRELFDGGHSNGELSNAELSNAGHPDKKLRAKDGVNLAEDYMMTNRLMLHARMAVTDHIVAYYDQTEEHDASKMYQNHIMQLTNAVIEVEKYYQADKAGRKYLPQIQMAYIYVIRTAEEGGLHADKAYSQLRLWAKPVARLLRFKPTFLFGNLLYKSIRTILL